MESRMGCLIFDQNVSVYDKPLALAMGSVDTVYRAFDGPGTLSGCAVEALAFRRGEAVYRYGCLYRRHHENR